MENMKFYGTIEMDIIEQGADWYDEDYWCDEATQEEINMFKDEIDSAIQRDINIDKHWKDSGNFMEYMKWGKNSDPKYASIFEKVSSAKLSTEFINDTLYSVMTCEVEGSLSAEDIELLKEEFIGQYSDGFGEGLEQRGFKTSGGNEIFVKLWNPNNFQMLTESEIFYQNNMTPDINL